MSVKFRVLEKLNTSRGESLSGESLARELGCTRAAIWKAVKTLQEEGLQIEAVPNKGYRLLSTGTRLSEEMVRLHLKCRDVLVEVLEETDSTNREAKALALEGKAGHGSVILAGRQSAGRGRRGRSFYSPEGGIYMSVVLRPGNTIEESMLFTTAAATAVYRAVEKVCGISLDIKWVNDLYRNGKKVCGILTEAVTDFESGQIDFIVVGIGINLFVDPQKVPEELKAVAGGIFDDTTDKPQYQQTDRNRLAAEVVNFLLEEIKRGTVSELYIRHNLIPGHRIHILDGERSRLAEALSVLPDGKLLVREEDGKETALSFGEVSVRLS